MLLSIHNNADSVRNHLAFVYEGFKLDITYAI